MKRLVFAGLALWLLSPTVGMAQEGSNGESIPYFGSNTMSPFDVELASTEEAYILERKTGPLAGKQQTPAAAMEQTLVAVEQALEELGKWEEAQFTAIQLTEEDLERSTAQKNALIQSIVASSQTEADPEETEWEGDERRDQIHMQSMALQDLEVQVWQLEETWVQQTLQYNARLREKEELEAIQDACEMMIAAASAD